MWLKIIGMQITWCWDRVHKDANRRNKGKVTRLGREKMNLCWAHQAWKKTQPNVEINQQEI